MCQPILALGTHEEEHYGALSSGPHLCVWDRATVHAWEDSDRLWLWELDAKDH